MATDTEVLFGCGLNDDPKIRIGVAQTDVSNPPTDAELDAIWGTPATIGAGFMSFLDDAGGGNNFYFIASDGTNWWTFTGTKAT